MNPEPFYETSRIIYLISGYLQEDLDLEEFDGLRKWRDGKPENEELFQLLISKEYQRQELANMDMKDTERAFQNIKAKLKPHTNYRLWIPIAAAVLLSIFALIKYFTPKEINDHQVVRVITDIAPGSNKAILRLADGRNIDLTESDTGMLASQSGLTTYKSKDGQLRTEVNSKILGAKAGINSISTPNGGTYAIVLPDGTKVTLNAASTLKYPTSFSPASRKVSLAGEAFFVVTKDKKHPFIVETDAQQVRVLGTQFNLNSYKDEPNTVTTLIEGSVKINNKILLKPGEQAAATGKSIQVSTADIASNIAWYNGELDYKDVDLPTIMRQVSRWYDVEVIYPNGVPSNRYTGTIDRNSNLSVVLQMFQISGMKFRMEERSGKKRLIINP